MTDSEKDAGIMEVLLERFEKQRLPRTLALKEKFDKGDTLVELYTKYLEDVLAEAQIIIALIDRHPE